MGALSGEVQLAFAVFLSMGFSFGAVVRGWRLRAE